MTTIPERFQRVQGSFLNALRHNDPRLAQFDEAEELIKELYMALRVSEAQADMTQERLDKAESRVVKLEAEISLLSADLRRLYASD